MARVTVEDCLEKVPNRFDLVLIAAKRARQLERGTIDPTVEWDNDKTTVVALREIAEGNVDRSVLRMKDEPMGNHLPDLELLPLSLKGFF